MLFRSPELIIYKREYQGEAWLVICNFYGREQIMPKEALKELEKGDARLLLGNYQGGETTERIRPYEARIYRCR